MNNNLIPRIASMWAVFQHTVTGNRMLFGSGDVLGTIFAPVIRLQAPKDDSVGSATLEGGTEILLGDELFDLDFKDGVNTAILLGSKGAEVTAELPDGSPAYKQIAGTASFFVGTPKTRPAYVKPTRPAFMVNHAQYNITHFRPEETVPGPDGKDIRVVSSRGGVTVAFYIDLQPSAEPTNPTSGYKPPLPARIYAGVALCSSEDNFCRSRGASTAVARVLVARQQPWPEAGYPPVTLNPLEDKPSSYHCSFPLIDESDMEITEDGVRLTPDIRFTLAVVLLSGLMKNLEEELAALSSRAWGEVADGGKAAEDTRANLFLTLEYLDRTRAGINAALYPYKGRVIDTLSNIIKKEKAREALLAERVQEAVTEATVTTAFAAFAEAEVNGFQVGQEGRQADPGEGSAEPQGADLVILTAQSSEAVPSGSSAHLG